MDKRPVNFSQKGFSRNFLALMKLIEKNDLCCLDFLTQVYTQNSSTVTFTGKGTQDDPLIAIATGGGSALTFDNGLTLTGTTVQFGGTLLQATDVDQSGFNLSFSGSGNLLVGTTTDAGFRFQVVGEGYISSTLLVGTTTVDATSSTVQSFGSISIQDSDSIYLNSRFGGATFSLFSSNGLNRIARVGGGFNTYFGFAAGGPNDATSCTAFGYGALSSGPNTGQNNTAIGVNALLSNTGGTDNAAFGINAGFGNLSGYGNVFFGTSAGFNITTQNQNTFVGVQTFVSAGQLHNNHGAIGANNTAIGYNAGGGGLNFAGTSTTISDSILIGIENGPAAEGNTIDNIILIGNGLVTSHSNIAMIGTTSIVSTMIGFANSTASDGNRLMINGALSLRPITLPGSPVNYSLETDGTHLYFTDGTGTRHTIV